MKKLGLDPGFGNIGAAWSNGTIEAVNLPSVVGVGSTESGALNLQGVFRGARRDIPHLVAFEGVEYLAGAGVSHFARPIERMDFQRFSDSPELRALIYAALYRLLGEGEHTVKVAIGLPVEVLQAESSDYPTEREMSAWLLGEHRFTVDSAECRIDVVGLKARLAQPLATWFEWGMDPEGQWARGAEAAKAPALIIDPGFNTLDVLAVEAGRISERYTGGETLGMSRAAEMVDERIRRRYGVEKSLHEIDELVQAVVSGRKAYLFVAGQNTDVTAEVRQGLDAHWADVSRFFRRKVGTGAEFNVLVTGGGALAMGQRLLGMFGHASLMPEPVLANARGLAKLAARDGYL